jgi:hypothetical protein
VALTDVPCNMRYAHWWFPLFPCLLAYCVNLSTYLVIGATSPVSYQVGHCVAHV